MIEIAKKYKAAGYHCIPTQEDKSPIKNWKWKEPFEIFPESYGIGIACGELSGGVCCIDIDNHFGDAKTLIKDYLNIIEVKEIYDKYKLPIETTVNGGYHLLFRCDFNEGNQKLASRPKEKNGKIIPDVIFETRGNNGYFVAAPTPGYKVIRNDIMIINKILPEEREILISAARSFNEYEKIIYCENEQTDRPGDIYNRDVNSKNEMIDLLRAEGWQQIGRYGWRRPDKKKGISATLGKVADNIFYNFSANGHPFEPEKAYTPFQVLALLKYNGNFSECAKAIAPVKIKNEIKPTEFESILAKARLNPNKEIEKPPVILKIKQIYNADIIEQRLFTLGNFSAITGKSKAKKTYLATAMITALLSGNFGHLVGNITDKKKVVSFDTEQSNYDAWHTANRVKRLIDIQINYESFALREYTEFQRCEIIDYYLSKNNDVGFILIDGIADLATAINDEEEASRVVGLLMKWSKIYECHICCIIHQNKNDNFATGHLGSAIMKKSEAVISVEKEKEDKRTSIVKCDLIRGVMDFDDFEIRINEKGLPDINTNNMMLCGQPTNVIDFSEPQQKEPPF